MVKINDSGNDLEMMKNIDDKFQALLSEFYKNIDKSKLLEQKVKEPVGHELIENVRDPRELSEVRFVEKSEAGKFESDDMMNGDLDENYQNGRVYQEPDNTEIDRSTTGEEECNSEGSEEKEDICLDSYTVGQMVEKLERKLQQTDDVSQEISRFRSGECVTTCDVSPKVRFDDTKSIYSSSTSFKRKRRGKRCVQFSLRGPSPPSTKQLVPKASMTVSSIGSKKKKKKRKFTPQNGSNVNWINFNRENLIKYSKKKEEKSSKRGRSKSVMILKTVEKGTEIDDPVRENSEYCNEKPKPLSAAQKPVQNQTSPSMADKQLRPVRSAHSKCIAVDTPAAKEVDMRQMSQVERDLFATIPFVVGRSISKTYHIGLSFQQTMSMIKRFSTCRDMVVTPIPSNTGDMSIHSTEFASSHRCAALDRVEDWGENGWDVETAKRRPRCTCLPEPRRSSSLRKVLRQLLARSEAAKSSPEPVPKAVRPSIIHLRMNIPTKSY